MDILTKYKTIIIMLVIGIMLIFIGTPNKHKEYDFSEMMEKVKTEALAGKKEAVFPVFVYYLKHKEYDKCREFYYKLIINNKNIIEIVSLLKKATIREGVDISICQSKK